MHPAQESPGDSRRTVFISHAHPEDNAAAAWFATQLTLLGYDVWCDVKDVRGGESEFWRKIQARIESSAKFVFLLSDVSRNFELKKGVYKEVQAAANLNRDNFIIPVSIAGLSGSVPILVGTDIYIGSQNWADGLRHLVERLRHDDVPLSSTPDYEKITSWWPALYAADAVATEESADVQSTILSIVRLPESVSILTVRSDGNLLAGHERLRRALPLRPPFSAHKDYAISFGSAHDYRSQASDFDIAQHATVPTAEFLSRGWDEGDVTPETAANMATYWIANSLEAFLASIGLSHKSVSRSARKIWYPSKGLIPKDKHSFLDLDGKKSTASLVGSLTSYRKEYFWHYAVQPHVDTKKERAPRTPFSHSCLLPMRRRSLSQTNMPRR